MDCRQGESCDHGRGRGTATDPRCAAGWPQCRGSCRLAWAGEVPAKHKVPIRRNRSQDVCRLVQYLSRRTDRTRFLFCKTWSSPGPPSTWPVLASSRCLGMLGRTDAGKTPGWRRARVWGKPVGGWSGRARVGTIHTIIMRPRDTILRALSLTSSCGENNARVMMNQLIKSCNAVRAGAFRDFSFRLASRAQRNRAS